MIHPASRNGTLPRSKTTLRSAKTRCAAALRKRAAPKHVAPRRCASAQRRNTLRRAAAQARSAETRCAAPKHGVQRRNTACSAETRRAAPKHTPSGEFASSLEEEVNRHREQ